jgi:hypothetical protein
MQTISDLAKDFSERLADYLGFGGLAIVVERNKTPKYTGCCASHDFCDANVFMLEAFEATFSREPDLECDHDLAMIDDAWNMAKRQGFEVQ